MKRKSLQTRGRGTVANGNQSSSVRVTTGSRENVEPSSSRQTPKRRSPSEDEWEDLHTEEMSSMSQALKDSDQSKMRQRKHRKMEHRRSSRKRGKSTECQEKDHFSSLSLEVICRILNYLPLTSILLLERQCQKLHCAVEMHLRIRKSIDLCQGSLFGWMPHALTDTSLGRLLARCKELVYVYGLHPPSLARRRSRTCNQLTVPGVVDALSGCPKLQGVEVSSIFLLEAILNYLPHLQILGTFRNRDGGLPFTSANSLSIPSNARISSLYLFGVSLPELPRITALTHLRLRWVKLTGSHPFSGFAAPMLQTFVMAHCQGPDNPLRYVPLFAGLAASRSLSRLELVRVNYLGGLIQHIVEDCWKLQGFRSLQSVTFAACKHALEADIGFLAITAENRLEELRVQPSLTKDSLFSALSMAGVTFPHFDSIALGYVDSEAHEDSRRQGFNFFDGVEAPESPAMLTDIGMGSVGQCFPTVTRLSIYNCPHLQYPTNWLSAGNPMHLFRSLSHLHLHRCHSIRLVNFGDFVSLLPSLEILHLEQMFREPPKGCARVGLSAGTGLGVSSALVQNHHAAAAAAANGVQPNNANNNNNNNNNLANNNNLPNNNNNAANNNNNAANNNNNNNVAVANNVGGAVAGEDDAAESDDENPVVDEDVSEALDAGVMVDEDENVLNDMEDKGGMVMSCDSDTSCSDDFDNTDYDPRDPEIYHSGEEINIKKVDSGRDGQPAQQQGDSSVSSSLDGAGGDGAGGDGLVPSKREDCFEEPNSNSGKVGTASGGEGSRRQNSKLEGESSASGGVGYPRCDLEGEDDAEVVDVEGEEKEEHQVSDGALPVMRYADNGCSSREGNSHGNKARNRRHTRGCPLMDSNDNTNVQGACKVSKTRSYCSGSKEEEVKGNSQARPNLPDRCAGNKKPLNTGDTDSRNSCSTEACMRVKTEPEVNVTSAGCSDFQRKRWRESLSLPRSEGARPGRPTWVNSKGLSSACHSARRSNEEDGRMYHSSSPAASSICRKREPKEQDEWEDLDVTSGSKGKSFVGKGKALMGRRQAAVKKSKPMAPSPPQDSSSGHRDQPDLKTWLAEDVDTSARASASHVECPSQSSGSPPQPGSSAAQADGSCQAPAGVVPSAPPWSDEESCSSQGTLPCNSPAPGTSTGSEAGQKSSPVSDLPGSSSSRGRSATSKQRDEKQASPSATERCSPSRAQKKGSRSLDSEPPSRANAGGSSSREALQSLSDPLSPGNISDCSSDEDKEEPPRLVIDESRANAGGGSSREVLQGLGLPGSPGNSCHCSFQETSDEEEPPRLMIDETWRGSEEEEGGEEASDKACQAVSEEIREATRRAREQQSQASASQTSGSSYRDCLRSASRLRSQQRSQGSASNPTASLPKNVASKPKTASAASASSVLSSPATPSTSSSVVGASSSGGGLECFRHRCDPGFSKVVRPRTSPKRRRRKPKMCDKSTSTSDPVMEDDHVQGLKISSRSLISVTLQMVGITDLVIEDCPRLSSINASACRVLRRVELQDLPVLRRVGFIQCRKLEEPQLLAELTELPECDRLVHLRPMRPVNRDQLEKLLFGSSDMECHVCVIYDECPDPNETLHERTHVSDLLDVFSSLNQHLLEQDRLPYGLGSDSRLLYTMSGEELDCPSWTVVTDIPWLRLLHSSPSFLDRSATGWHCGEVGRGAVEELLQMLGPHIAGLEELGLGLFPHCMLVYISMSDVTGAPQDDYYV